ncbi:MAG: phospholipid carrier-dependent glycosyltransferase [Campylobacterales bacterium]|nr:phospholipid carrier-dependent glycosyltransferase [Campylobacterales bacterium]
MSREFLKQNLLSIYLSIVLIIGFFTYFKNYEYPNAQFWDENYHIASAQKYIDGVMYMEPHPPLGKMFIALGEVILNPNSNIDKNYFNQTDYIKEFPKGYSFKGVRFFPTLFAYLSVALFFMIIYIVTKNSHYAFLFSSIYLFENAFITHSRAAMLESSQIFFMMASVLYLVYIKENSITKFLNYGMLGILVGFALAVKANSAILFLLPIFLIYTELKENFSIKELVNIIPKLTSFSIGVALIFFSVMYMHVSFGDKIEQNRTYKASSEYLEIIKNGSNSNISNFLTTLKDNFKFMKEYQDGVPKLDLCKVGENGSLAIGWILGIKSINYRWEKTNDGVKYMYLQGNPIIWYFVLAGVLLSFALISSRILFSINLTDTKLFDYILLFLILYISYMIAILQIDRVMYLYHYFMPLSFGMFGAIFVLYYIFQHYIEQNDKIVWLALIMFVALVIYVYIFFAPFSYYEPLNTYEFMKRVWFNFWQLTPIR